jgi:hypothetical protein
MPTRSRRHPAGANAARAGRDRRPRMSGAAAMAPAVGALILWTAGCSSPEPSGGGTPSASELPSVAASAASAAASSVQSAASALSSAAASAIGKVANGIDARGDIRVGAVVIGGDGRATAPLTIRNSASKNASYVIETDFRDPSGNLLDVAVVTAKDVAPGRTLTATARSNRTLTGDVTAVVARAVRY